MAQSDQTVQNATFPTVRADINDNLAALFSQSSGNSAPGTTVAFQPWVDTSSSPAVWKVRNATNSGWITIGVLDATFAVGGVTPIANGGTGQTTASGAINALVPSQTGNADKFLKTDGSLVSWAVAAAGANIQVFTSSGTYTPTSGKATFVVFATGGGGGGGGANISVNSSGSSGGGGGTAVRLYNTTEMGASASVTIGSGGSAGNTSGSNGSAGGSTSFDPGGSGLTITGNGGGGGQGNVGGAGTSTGGGGGSTVNSIIDVSGQKGTSSFQSGLLSAIGVGGSSFWGGGRGSGGHGAFYGSQSNAGAAGTAGVVFVLEF